MDRKVFKIAEPVAEALKKKKPVVILESAIISFGLPHPLNLSVALECEEIVRKEGAIPATVGIVQGVLKVGLTGEELEAFAARKDMIKTNLGNLSTVCGSGRWGATTVSASLFAASRAGAGVFVTGGIGGIHRGFPEKVDVSSDLAALERFSILVVCAGVKSLLDVPATLEILETLGIPILGYQTDVFPMFYVSRSAYPVDLRVESPEQAAKVFQAHQALGLKSGILVANPVSEKDGMDPEELESAMKQAEAELTKHSGIQGRDVTPFLLQRLEQITGGRTLKANCSLIRNNCRLGARIALELFPLDPQATGDI